MKRPVLLATVCFAIVAGVSAEENKQSAPVPPRLCTINSMDQKQGDVVIVCPTVRFIWQPNRISIYEGRVSKLSLASTDCFDVQGNKLTADEIFKHLSVGDVVAISADGEKVDPAFLKALAKDTLVFVSAEYAVNNVLSLTDPSGQTPKVATPAVPRAR